MDRNGPIRKLPAHDWHISIHNWPISIHNWPISIHNWIYIFHLDLFDPDSDIYYSDECQTKSFSMFSLVMLAFFKAIFKSFKSLKIVHKILRRHLYTLEEPTSMKRHTPVVLSLDP